MNMDDDTRRERRRAGMEDDDGADLTDGARWRQCRDEWMKDSIERFHRRILALGIDYDDRHEWVKASSERFGRRILAQHKRTMADAQAMRDAAETAKALRRESRNTSIEEIMASYMNVPYDLDDENSEGK